MQTITEQDIIVELTAYEKDAKDERENARLEKVERKLDALHFGKPSELWAVCVEYDVRYGTSGSIVGLYESKEVAERAADLLTERNVLMEESDFYWITPVTMNAHPDNMEHTVGWFYME